MGRTCKSSRRRCAPLLLMAQTKHFTGLDATARAAAAAAQADADAAQADVDAHEALIEGAHGVPTMATGQGLIWNNTTNQWEATDIATQAELNAAIAGISTTPGDDTVTEEKLTDALAVILGITKVGLVHRGYAQVLTDQSTTSTSVTDLTTAGPSVTVTVPTNGLVALYAQAEMKISSGANLARLYVNEATDLGDLLVTNVNSTSFAVKTTAPGNGTGAIAPLGSFLIFPATAGSRTYKLRYNVDGGTGNFKNRKLWVFTHGV